MKKVFKNFFSEKTVILTTLRPSEKISLFFDPTISTSYGKILVHEKIFHSKKK